MKQEVTVTQACSVRSAPNFTFDEFWPEHFNMPIFSYSHSAIYCQQEVISKHAVNAMKQEVVVTHAYNVQSAPNFTFDKSPGLNTSKSQYSVVIIAPPVGNWKWLFYTNLNMQCPICCKLHMFDKSPDLNTSQGQFSVIIPVEKPACAG